MSQGHGRLCLFCWRSRTESRPITRCCYGWQQYSYTLVSHPRGFKATLNNGTVYDLKKLIQELRKNGVFRNVDAKDLVLWKVGLFNNLNVDSLTLSVAPRTRTHNTRWHSCWTHTVTRSWCLTICPAAGYTGWCVGRVPRTSSQQASPHPGAAPTCLWVQATPHATNSNPPTCLQPISLMLDMLSLNSHLSSPFRS